MRRRKSAEKKKRLFIKVFVFMLVFFMFRTFNCKVSAGESAPMVKYYTSVLVRQGDTVTDIANKYMSSEYKSLNEYIEEVRHMNCLTEDCKIHSGEYIIVPYYDYLEGADKI